MMSDLSGDVFILLAIPLVALGIFLCFSVLKSRDGDPRVPGMVLALAFCVLVAFGFSGKAHAQTYSCPSTKSPKCDAGAAYAAASSMESSDCPVGTTVGALDRIEHYPISSTEGSYAPYIKCMQGANVWMTLQGYNQFYGSTCQGRGEATGWAAAPAVCSQGCKYFGYNDPSIGTIFSTCNDTDPGPGITCGAGSFSVCTVEDVPPPELDTDGDGVPDDEDAFPNDPNESADSDGDGIGDNADVAPDDPTNGDDTEGEEDGDDEGDNSAGGGGDCRAPPTCKGDGIACNTNFQVWKTRCAVEANGGAVTGNPGDCNSGYTCSENGVGCAQLAVQRAAMCGSEPGEGDGDGTVAGGAVCAQPYVCTGGDAIACASLREQHRMRCLTVGDGAGEGDDELGPELDPGEYIGVGQEGSGGPLDLDASGWLGGSCPSIVADTFKFEGSADAFCSGGSVLSFYVMFLAYLTAGRIIGRAASGSAA